MVALVVLVVAAGAYAPRAGAQEMGASVSTPFRHDIDGRCDRLEHAPANSWTHFERIAGRPGATPRWARQISGKPAAGAAQSQDETLPAGTFAHVVQRNGHVVFVSLWQTAGNGDDGGTTTYCYAGDRLIRMRTQQVVANTTGTLTRTRYYDGGKLLTHSEQKTNFTGEELNRPLHVRDTPPVYMRPSALPFASLLAKRRSGA
ncbi:MAG: hypothetical protein M3169_04720 [Candidatus Eremiobacteraeota bacterium]|nr:hypothetical protein [Candidatus Eremiobacteraeota bacterium]